MELIQALVLGLVQGLTEFLPVSSSAHLRFVPALLGWEDPGAAFTAVTQIGTELAVLIYFRRDIAGLVRGFLRGLRSAEARQAVEWRLAWYVGIGTIPIGVLGFVFADVIEGEVRDQLALMAVALIGVGLLLYVADRRGPERRGVEDLRLRDALVLGLAQAAALFPGVSRSGGTITAGRFLGLTREAATRFSFLLAIPAVLASGLFTLPDVVAGDGLGVVPTALATVLAFAVGYAAIAGLLKFVVHHTLLVFVVYRVALGTLMLVLLAAGIVE
jgi:undecaprenyl-diphosphatase